MRPAAGGAPYACDSAGAPWRTVEFIDGTRTEPRFHGPAQAAAGAAIASRLVAHLSDLDGPPLPEVIPGFHRVVSRLSQLRRARQADVAGRAVGCKAEGDAVLDYTVVAREVAEARTDGRLPERTVHNDAKTDNLLFDEATGAALCMVDLDTVGPGTVLFDVGDLVRSGAALLPEDGDPDAATVDRGIVAAILEGYARAGADFLTPGEVNLFPLAGPLMALEAAARFLTDHLQGDVYFRVNGPAHNLLRARNQLRILELLMAA